MSAASNFLGTGESSRGLGEAFTGYDYLNIAGVDLQGLLFGVRLWF